MIGLDELRVRAPGSTGVRVVEVDPCTDPRWDAFVGGHPDGLIYHRSRWLQIIEKVYARQPLCLACEGPGGDYDGVLPLFRADGLLMGRRFSSLPHTPVAGPLVRSDTAAAALMREARDRVDREPGTWLQLKLPSAPSDGLGDGLVVLPGQETYVLELPERVDDLRFGDARNHARLRWSVRKAAKENLEVRTAENRADLEGWYRLYLDTMRWHTVPPRPFRFFEAAWELLRPEGLMRLLLAEKVTPTGGRIVAGSIFLLSGRTVLYAFSGWRREDLGQRANDAIQWRAIHDACREGYRRYDFGEVEEHNQGLAAFKSKWGGRPHRLYRCYYPAPGRLEARALSASAPAAGLLRAAWRRLPLRITAAVGDRLYRGS
jgi:CelD/BcsL family acetyltransferase involved in cellulose biosynthesis